MERMDEGRLIGRVRERTGAGGREARRVLVAVVRALAGCIDDPARRGLAAALPESMSGDVDVGAPARPLDLEGLYAEVQLRSGSAPSHALEAAQAVLEALAAALPEEVSTHLRKQLHASIADRMVEPERDAEAPPHVHVHAPWAPVRPPTLSTGRPGPTAPVSESRPGAPQRGSVAASSNPHGDAKLSSARGTTQEQDDRTLSEARPDRR